MSGGRTGKIPVFRRSCSRRLREGFECFSCSHARKCSIKSSTSRRFSGEILSEPLWAPLYCNSSLCSNNRLNRSRESSLSPNVSAAVSTSTVFGSTLHARRSEEHTSELQSHVNLVCRLLLEK